MTDKQLTEAVAVEIIGLKIKGPYFYLPDPLHDWNHTHQVIDKMRERGWSFLMEIEEDTTHVKFYRAPYTAKDAFNKDPQRAILECALKAVRSER